MDWKEFLKPSWKKALGSAALYGALTSIFLCTAYQSISPSMQCTCVACPVEGLAALFFLAIPATLILLATALQNNPAGSVIILVLAVLVFAISYILACTIGYLLAKKAGETGKKKKTTKNKRE